MPPSTCTRCGAALRNGACPNGHPQRAARRRGRRRRPWLRRLITFLLIVGLLAGAAYGGLVWYPLRAAGDLMVPSSEEFREAQAAYRTVVDAYPTEPTEETLPQMTAQQLGASGRARTLLGETQARLEARGEVTIPVVSSRPPLRIAHRVRLQMLDFYIGALEMVANLEGIASYLTQLVPTLDKANDLEEALGSPSNPGEVNDALGPSRPIADQLVADVEALTPPAELGSVHEALRAIATRARQDLDELDDIAGRGAGPIIATLVDEIGRQIEAFHETVLDAPGQAREAGIGARLEHLERLQRRIADGLRRLSEEFEIAVTLPPPPGPVVAPAP